MITGVALLDLLTQEATVQSVTTTVRLRPMTDSEIRAYASSGDPLDKAGAYAIQSRLFHPVESIEGCYPNVVGLPLCKVARMVVGRGGVLDDPGWADPKHCPCNNHGGPGLLTFQKTAECI